jgi:thiamine biosynthesis lipoprotein
MPLAVHRHRFRAMGTRSSWSPTRPRAIARSARAAERAERTFAREDRRCLRFREDSELSEVNRRAGRPTLLSPGLATIVRHALAAAAGTDGRRPHRARRRRRRRVRP